MSVVARLVNHVEESDGSWRSVLRLDAPKSSPDLRLLRLARCINLTRAWTTSDIGGRNSGSGCTLLNKMFTIGNSKWRDLCDKTCMRIGNSYCKLVHHTKVEKYLYTEGNYISEARKWFCRVDSLQSRVHHFGQRINVVELGSGPSHQWLFGSGPCTAKTQHILWS